MNVTELDLDPDQRAALDLALGGANVFITGAAGSGKSTLMTMLLDRLGQRGRVAVLTASTGIAALNIGGRTIHSFLGTACCVNVEQARVHMELAETEARMSSIKWRLTRADVIVVDEVSMLTGDYVDMIDWWLRELLGRSEPFAGRQMVFVGDFFQLPPVITREMRAAGLDRDLAFKAQAWRRAGVETTVLTHNHRQRSDAAFKAALDSLRSGDLTPETRAFFAACVERDLDEPTILFPTNAQVAAVNAAKLAALPGKSFTLRASFSGPEWAQKRLIKLCYVEQHIKLKVGATVILARNVYDEGGEAKFVNGDRGTIMARQGDALTVRLERDGGRLVGVERERFHMRNGDGKIVATMRQHPLKLAYALSIHKSQGMTLSRVRADLGRCFAEGQAYTALSRARSAAGLSLAGPLSRRQVFTHPDCVMFYERKGKVRFM